MPESAAPDVSLIDHIGIVVRDLESARAFVGQVLGLPETRVVELPELNMTAIFFRCGGCDLELIGVSDTEQLTRRLSDGALAQIEHIAIRVPNLETAMHAMRLSGVRWCSEPGGAAQDDGVVPVHAAGARNVWTAPQTSAGVMWQLVERFRPEIRDA